MQRFRRHIRTLSVAAAGLSALTAAAVSAAPVAHAAASVVPIGVQAGTFNYPVSCNATGIPIINTLNNIPLSALVTGEAPTSVGAGQSFYLTQGRGSVTIPQALISLATVIGAKYTDPTVTKLLFGASNATPSSIDLAASGPISVGTLALPSSGGLTAGLPLTGTYTIGPFKAGTSGQMAATFSEIDVTAPLLTSQTSTSPVATISIKCTPSSNGVIRSISIGGKDTAAQLKPTNPVASDPSVAVGNVSGTIDAPATCSGTGFTPQGVGFELNGTFPLTSTSFSLTNAGGSLVLPPNTVNYLISKGAKTVSGKVSAVNINATGATPASINALASGGTIPSTPLVKGKQVVIPVASGLTVGPFAIGASGATITVGTAAATITAGSTTYNVNCAAPSPTVILANVTQ